MEYKRGSSSSKHHEGQVEEKDSSLPLHEYVARCGFVRNRAYHRALLLFRAVLCLLFLNYRLRGVISGSFNGDLGSCRFPGGKLGLVAMGCELWLCSIFFLSIWLKWFMVERVAHPDRLLNRGVELPAVDVFVTTADPIKEPPLITVNTVLSTLALHYPSHKLSIYVSDDGGSLLTLWALKEAVSFAKCWIPFCNKFFPYICPRAPGPYFASKGAVEKANFYNFSNEWHAIKAEYLTLESRISSMSAAYCVSKKETLSILLTKLSTSTFLDGHKETYSSWAFNYDPQNHSSHCELRVSGIMTNAPFILNLDCDMYVNDAKALLQAMCFFMQEKEEQVDHKIGFVQFPQCFEGVDEDDVYGSHMAVMIEVFSSRPFFSP